MRFSQRHQGFCAATLHTSKVGNVKIARSERSYYCCIHIRTFHIVWLLRNLSLDGKLCLRDDKNPAFVKFAIPCHCMRTWKRHATREHRQEAVSDSDSSSDCCAGQRLTPRYRTLEVRPGRITKKLGLKYDYDCERDDTKSLLGVLMLGCDILIANDE